MATPTTDLDLANMALFKLGHTVEIVNLTTDTTVEAKAARRFVDVDRERALQAFGATRGGTGWRWAQKRAVLVAAAGQSHERWEYFYTIPTDLVPNTGWLWNGDPNPAPDELAEFEVILNAAGDGKVIACNLEPEGSPATGPVFVYTKLVTNVALYPQTFVNFFAWLLASDLAFSVVGEGKLAIRDRCLAEAQRALHEAIAAELRGGQPNPVSPKSPSLRARG